LKVSGKAPDEITWEGLFGVTEQPLPKPKEPSAEAQYGYADGGDTSEVKEPRTPYFAANPALYPRRRKSDPRGSEPKKDRSAMRKPGTSIAVLPSTVVPRGSSDERRQRHRTMLSGNPP